MHQDPIGLEGGDNLFLYAPNTSNWSDALGLAPKKRCGCRRDPCDITRHRDQPSPRRPQRLASCSSRRMGQKSRIRQI
nr:MULTISPECIES: hypothetical protein [unclassified Delftia]